MKKHDCKNINLDNLYRKTMLCRIDIDIAETLNLECAVVYSAVLEEIETIISEWDNYQIPFIEDNTYWINANKLFNKLSFLTNKTICKSLLKLGENGFIDSDGKVISIPRKIIDPYVNKNKEKDKSIFDFKSYIYILESKGLYKIGSTDDIDSRLSTIRTGNADQINLVKAYKVNFKDKTSIENKIHKKLNKKRIYGTNEWYKYDLDRVLEIVKGVVDE